MMHVQSSLAAILVHRFHDSRLMCLYAASRGCLQTIAFSMFSKNMQKHADVKRNTEHSTECVTQTIREI